MYWIVYIYELCGHKRHITRTTRLRFAWRPSTILLYIVALIYC